MKRNGKYFKAGAGLTAGMLMLTAAVFANYDNANGYSTCKEALKGLLYTKNMSIDYNINVQLDGRDLTKSYGGFKLNVGGNPSSRSEITSETDGSIDYTLQQRQDGLEIYKYHNDESETPYGYYYTGYEEDKALMDSANEVGNNFGEKLLNFGEVLGDTLIGDLKNNFVLTDKTDGISTYQITLSRDQMPAYVNSGISLISSAMASDAGSQNDELTLNILGGSEPYVRDMALNMSIDGDNHPSRVWFTVNLAGFDDGGAEHTLTLNADVEMYDFGKTEIERISDDELSKMDNYDKLRVDTDSKVEIVETEDAE